MRKGSHCYEGPTRSHTLVGLAFPLQLAMPILLLWHAGGASAAPCRGAEPPGPPRPGAQRFARFHPDLFFDDGAPRFFGRWRTARVVRLPPSRATPVFVDIAPGRIDFDYADLVNKITPPHQSDPASLSVGSRLHDATTHGDCHAAWTPGDRRCVSGAWLDLGRQATGHLGHSRVFQHARWQAHCHRRRWISPDQ